MKRAILLLGLLVACAASGSTFAQTSQDPVQQQQKNGRRGAKHFQQLDKNNDGQIARDEWTRKPKAFDRLDLNHDGVITKEEMQELHKMRKGKR